MIIQRKGRVMLERVKDILEDYVEVPRDKIKLESAFIDELGLSSLDVVNIVVAFEEEFDVEISDRMISKIVTVGDVVKILNGE